MNLANVVLKEARDITTDRWVNAAILTYSQRKQSHTVKKKEKDKD